MFLVKEKSFYKLFFRLTFMIAMQNVIVFGVNLADNIMLGKYTEEALSAEALVNQIQFMLQKILFGIGEGVGVLIARYWGKKDGVSIRRLVTIGLWLGALSSLILWGAMFFFSHPCLSLLSNDEAVLSEGIKYLKIVCFSYLFFAITNIILISLRNVETAFVGFAVSVAALVINVTLNYTLIYGNFGAPKLGVQGAAIATLIARIVETCIAVSYLIFFDKKIKYHIRHVFKIDFLLVKNYFKIGFPVLMSNMIWGIAMAIQTSILGHMGSAAIAANSVATTLFQIVSVISFGMAGPSCTIIGKTIGEGNEQKVRQYAKTMQFIYLIGGICTGLILFSLKDLIVGFYDISGEAKALSLQFITALSVTVCGTAYQMPVLTGIVRGGGDTRFVLINDTIFMWLLVLPASALAAFVFHFSPLVVFICLKSDQVLKCAVAVVKVNFCKWMKIWSTAPKDEKNMATSKK